MIDHCYTPIATSQSSIISSLDLTQMFKQVFVDCMPGPTHHFGGHSIGNLPSMQSKNTVANPKKAALEWLEKVNAVRLTGAHQCILPPHPRPLCCHIKNPTLTELSSGFMWMANAGHFIPSIDTKINHHQFIPANMNHSQHRNKEHRFHRYWIKKITHDIPCTIHSPITANDEGAAMEFDYGMIRISLAYNCLYTAMTIMVDFHPAKKKTVSMK